MKKNNIIAEKTYHFALRIIKLSQFLKKKNEFLLARQILKSGTSIGANVEESIGGRSEKDFFAKLTIAYKEARETKYWLRLFRDSQIIDEKLAKSFLEDNEEILKIIGKIQTTIRRKNSSFTIENSSFLFSFFQKNVRSKNNQSRTRANAQRRRDYGCRQSVASENRRKSRRGRGDGARTRPERYSRGRRRRAGVRSGNDY